VKLARVCDAFVPKLRQAPPPRQAIDRR